MKRLAIAMVVTAACSSGQKKPTTGAGSGSGPALYAKKISIGWGFQATGGTTDVFLQTTDETGKQVSYPLGAFPGACAIAKPAPEMKAISGVACSGTPQIELHAVIQDTDIVVLKLRKDGATADPMAREEVTRVKTPGGAAIEAGS